MSYQQSLQGPGLGEAESSWWENGLGGVNAEDWEGRKPACSWPLRTEAGLAIFSSLLASGGGQQPSACGCIIPASASTVTRPSLLSVYTSVSLFLKRHQSLDWDPL